MKVPGNKRVLYHAVNNDSQCPFKARDVTGAWTYIVSPKIDVW